MKEKKIELFKDSKKKKCFKNKDAMDFAKDAVIIGGSLAVLGAGLSLLD